VTGLGSARTTPIWLQPVAASRVMTAWRNPQRLNLPAAAMATSAVGLRLTASVSTARLTTFRQRGFRGPRARSGTLHLPCRSGPGMGDGMGNGSVFRIPSPTYLADSPASRWGRDDSAPGHSAAAERNAWLHGQSRIEGPRGMCRGRTPQPGTPVSKRRRHSGARQRLVLPGASWARPVRSLADDVPVLAERAERVVRAEPPARLGLQPLSLAPGFTLCAEPRNLPAFAPFSESPHPAPVFLVKLPALLRAVTLPYSARLVGLIPAEDRPAPVTRHARASEPALGENHMSSSRSGKSLTWLMRTAPSGSASPGRSPCERTRAARMPCAIGAATSRSKLSPTNST
jgi:hypothetical protein